MSTIKVNTVTKRTGSTLTLGESGTTVTLACGASQSGFGRTGTVDWCTTAKTSPFTSESGKGYFVNTTSGAITVTLPASPSAGDIVSLKDYANTFDTNNVTVCRNGSKINGVCGNATLDTESQSVTLIYVDGTKGWQDIQDSTSNVEGAQFISATGGTVTTSGDFKIHTFTSDATFCVSSAGNASGSNSVEYLVVAGGGAGSSRVGGGGGAGGFRFFASSSIATPYPASPLNGPTAIPVSVQGYPITVGGGGSGSPPSNDEIPGGDGSNSVFSTITSTGGGGGLGNAATAPGRTGDGGSGGGGSPTPGNANAPGGTGNNPPVSPSQGNNGGLSGVNYNGGGGGGALAVGGAAGPLPANPTAGGGDGGVGGGFPTTHFGANGQLSSCVRYFSGGGGGGAWTSGSPGPGGCGALGGGADGVTSDDEPSYPTYRAGAGTANTGGGGGGAGGGNANPNPFGPALLGGTGGSGIVVIRYKFQ